MAAIFGVSTGAYYKWAKQGPSQRQIAEDAALLGLIREIASKHRWRYGSLRNDCGKRASLKKTARLMRENGLNARRRGKCIPAANSNHGLCGLRKPVEPGVSGGNGGSQMGAGHYVSAGPGRVARPDQ
jgi:hypothetical protein